MKRAREGRRFRCIERVIKESFCRLAERMPLDRITVKGLCELADINRGTFYAHYAGLFALLEALEAEMAADLYGVISKMYVGENYFPSVLDGIFCYLKGNPLMSMLLLDGKSTGTGVRNLQELARAKIVEHWMARGTVDRQQAEWIYTFFAAGCYALLRQWYQNGFSDDPKRLGAALDGVVTRGLNGYVYGAEKFDSPNR